ncbi:hypothetical protein BJ912DRAFT_664487 [Pholiota molesta]|nr:hypothetical protein BJ912DRAFT_664487 [Pholiota molesta]
MRVERGRAICSSSLTLRWPARPRPPPAALPCCLHHACSVLLAVRCIRHMGRGRSLPSVASSRPSWLTCRVGCPGRARSRSPGCGRPLRASYVSLHARRPRCPPKLPSSACARCSSAGLVSRPPGSFLVRRARFSSAGLVARLACSSVMLVAHWSLPGMHSALLLASRRARGRSVGAVRRARRHPACSLSSACRARHRSWWLVWFCRSCPQPFLSPSIALATVLGGRRVRTVVVAARRGRAYLCLPARACLPAPAYLPAPACLRAPAGVLAGLRARTSRSRSPPCRPGVRPWCWLGCGQ